MLVMALEDYDATSGTAAKAAIMKKDVVGRAPPVTAVATAEEGLLVSLDRKGEVDLAYIAVALREPTRPASSRSWATSSTRTPRRSAGRRPTTTSRGTSGRSSRVGRGGRARVRPERRGAAGRAARGRAPRRHRRQPRGPVDPRGRHPGVRRRALRRAALLDRGRAPEEGRRLERRGRLRRAERRRRDDRLRHGRGPTGRRSSSRP